MVIRRKQFAGYGETMLDGAEYIGAQTGGFLAENVLDPLDKLGEYYDKSPFQSQRVTRLRNSIKPTSQLLKKSNRDNQKKRGKSRNMQPRKLNPKAEK